MYVVDRDKLSRPGGVSRGSRGQRGTRTSSERCPTSTISAAALDAKPTRVLTLRRWRPWKHFFSVCFWPHGICAGESVTSLRWSVHRRMIANDGDHFAKRILL